ncbi:MAG: response regulator [Candidatus Poribacteria bacterium]|nr:MAG: response regulator [Candidatus Poribacteria bacterium]
MSRRVLVIDDEPDILRLVRLALEFKGGYRVFVADDPREGLVQAKLLQPDLILLDVLMPGLSGYEVLDRLRRDPRTARIPVVLLTARAQKREIQEGLQRDVIGYITKPFEALRLVEVLEEMLQFAQGLEASSSPGPALSSSQSGSST